MTTRRPASTLDDDDYEAADGIDFRLLETDEEGMPAAFDDWSHSRRRRRGAARSTSRGWKACCRT